MNSFRERVGVWIESEKIQTWIIFIIMFNALTLGLQTSDYLESNFGEIFDILDVIIPAIFFLEIVIKIYAFDIRFFKTSWNVFDFFIVIVCLLPESGPLRILRTLRILRVLRLVRKLPRLRMIIEAVLHSLPSLNWVIILLLLVFYIYGLIGTLIFGPVFEEWFGTLGESMFSLFQVMTLESWSMGIARPVIKVFPYAWVYFLSFIMIATYTSINIFIAIMVNTVQYLSVATEELDKSENKNESKSETQKLLEIPQKEEMILKKEDEIIKLLTDIQQRLTALEKSKK